MGDINKLKLRTDGIYVQFGYRPWSSWLGITNDCWYNMLKVVDDNHLVLIGQFNRFPFFEIKEGTHKQIERKFCLGNNNYSNYSSYDIHINEEEQNSYNNIENEKLKSLLIDKHIIKMNLRDYFNIVSTKPDLSRPQFMSIYRKDDSCEKQFVDCDINCSIIDKSFSSVIDYDNVDDFEVIKDMYSYLNINYLEDDFDVINIVKKLENFDWNSLENKIHITGIDYIKNKYSNGEEDNDNNDIIRPKIISRCSYSECNDHFITTTYSDDINTFYIKNSHCWIEGNVMDGSDEHLKYGNEESNGNQIPFNNLTNSFKFTFVPFDLSEKSIWIDEYLKWKERYEYHKYYENKKNNENICLER
jgi:hypothetical protein